MKTLEGYRRYRFIVLRDGKPHGPLVSMDTAKEAAKKARQHPGSKVTVELPLDEYERLIAQNLDKNNSK